MPRSLLTAVLVGALIAAAPAATRAYEISLVYPSPSPVEGPVSVVAEVWVTVTAAELPLPYVQFALDFGCDGGADPCVLFHGSAYATQVFAFPFGDLVDQNDCAGITCECLSQGRYRRTMIFPAAGTFKIANAHISRIGTGPTPGGCDPNYLYDEVVVDWGCFNDPKCTGSGQFILQGAPLATESRTWGAVKALYR